MVVVKKIFRDNPIKIGLVFLCVLSFVGLQLWNAYAPLSIHDRNQEELSRIKVLNPDDFTFAVFGDNKGNHTFFDPLLRDIGRDREIVFAIDVGDLVGNGKRSEYRRFLNQVQKNLTIPFLASTGNHDFNNGFDHYRSIFGPTYYVFQVGQCSFIVLDATKESGLDKTERQWLEDELRKAQDAKARFIFMHIPPFDPRGGMYLPEKDKDDLLDLFRRYKVTHLFASHIHGYFSGTWEGVPYTITGGAGARLQGNDPEHFFHHYMRVHVNNGKEDLTVRRINGENAVVRFYGFLGDNIVEVGLLLGVVICVLSLWFSVRRRTDGLW